MYCGFKKRHYVAISLDAYKHLRGKEAYCGRYLDRKGIKNVAYVSLHAQLDSENMDCHYYFKLCKYDLYDEKTRGKAISMFGKGTVEIQDAILNDLQEKIESDNREKESYT